MSESQTPAQDQRCQSGPSAKRNYGADQQRLQISDLHFDKFLHYQHAQHTETETETETQRHRDTETQVQTEKEDTTQV